MISLHQINKIYMRGTERVDALSDVSLEINKGEYVCIVGPSGSGKSTLMNVVGLLDRPSSGNVSIAGRNLWDLNKAEQNQLRRRTIGFIFQQFLLIPTMTALQNVMLPLYFAGNGNAGSRSLELLDRVGIKHRARHLPSEMSGGEMQRTAIARALANNPSVILADEPCGNLDSKTAEDVYALFREINREGTTIIMVTHNQGLAASFPRIISLRDGRLDRDERQ